MSALGPAYAGITSVVENLDDDDLLRPSGCHGWSVADLLLHVTLDAQRALVALHTPATAPPTADAVTYWKTPGGAPSSAHSQFVRRSAAAFNRPSGIVPLWTDTAAAATHAATSADPDLRVATQGHILTVPDFLATLVTEAALHHLDLITSLPDAPAPAPAVTAVALSTLAGLAPLPAQWTEREALLKATGRAPLTLQDRQALGDTITQFPLIS